MKTALATIALALALPRLRPHKPLEQCVAVSTTVWSADGEVLRVTLAADDHIAASPQAISDQRSATAVAWNRRAPRRI
jgi:hypothetical protein